jgi:hypothetical protein
VADGIFIAALVISPAQNMTIPNPPKSTPLATIRLGFTKQIEL